MDEEPPRGGAPGAPHDLAKPADIRRYANAHRQVKYFLAEFDHAGEERRATGEHDARGEQLLEAAAPQLRLRQRVELLDPRLDHLGERLSRQLPRSSISGAG